ncbi:uncharacterized protein LOC142382483 isoform X2 [Odontesthes bonariensis]|uniref:uncharacterized protein LOC142382483 isoform X2 n=1 Tax=Odontesthes bonariensis TaxID=219752 RepID=UPI003F5836BB
MEKNLRDEETESTQNAKLKPNKRHKRNINPSNDVINESQFNADTGDQAVICEVCGKAFMNHSELRAHCRIHTDLSQQYVCKEEEILTDQQFFNHESNSSLDQQEPEPPQFKEELEERCTSQEEEWLELKQETDILSVTPTHEESELTSDQLLSQNSSVAERQEMEKNLRDEESESTENAKLKPHKRRGRNINHSNDVINESQFNADTGDQAVKCEVCGKAFMSYSELRAHCGMHTDLSQQYVCEEKEEILTDQQFFNHESNSSLDQQEPEPPQFKEELEERCTSQEEEWLELKQETDILSVTPTHEESELTSEQLLSQNSSVAERQEMEKNLRDEESESTQNAKLKPHKRRGRNINHSNDVINESQFNADTGDQAVICGVCGKAFMSYSNLRAHSGMHTGKKPYSCEICKKAFRQKKGLLVHRRTHTGEKPYVCKTCGKCFS